MPITSKTRAEHTANRELQTLQNRIAERLLSLSERLNARADRYDREQLEPLEFIAIEAHTNPRLTNVVRDSAAFAYRTHRRRFA